MTEVFSEDVEAGRVVAQEPAGGQAPEGSTVALQVSKGPELVTVPDVTGRPRGEAVRALEALGLKTRRAGHPRTGHRALHRPRRGGARSARARRSPSTCSRGARPLAVCPGASPQALPRGLPRPGVGRAGQGGGVREGDRRRGAAGLREQPARLGAEPGRPGAGRGVPRAVRGRRPAGVRPRAVPRELRLPHRGDAHQVGGGDRARAAPRGGHRREGRRRARRQRGRRARTATRRWPSCAATCCRCSTPPTPTARGCSSSPPPAAARRSAAPCRSSSRGSPSSTHHELLGVCLDTCHAWAAGHDVAAPGGMKKTLDALVKAVGRGRLALVHANDSKDPVGSTRDRHEAIGQGHIGKDAFAELFRHPSTRGVPVSSRPPATPPATAATSTCSAPCATPRAAARRRAPPGSCTAAPARGRRGCGSRAPPRSRAGPR